MVPRKILSFIVQSAIVGIITAALLTFILPNNWLQIGSKNAAPDNNTNFSAGPYSYADAVAKAAPAVVNIYTKKLVPGTRRFTTNNPQLERMLQNMYGRKLDRVAPDFQLLDTQMNQHRLSQHKGKFVFLYFGYLNCNDVCHNQVGVMFNINNQTENKDIDFIFVTMDPKRDSPAMLTDYFNQFGSNFFALTGHSMAEIQKVASLYKAYFFPDGETKTGQDYEISHPGSIFLIDPDGKIQLVYQNIYLRYDKIIEDLNKLRKINRLKKTKSKFK